MGILIVLGAFYLQSKNGEANVNQAVVTVAPERQYIETTDSDGDGTPDWQEGLEAKIFEDIESPASDVSTNTEDTYTPPTTFTGKFSEAFFKSYMEGKIQNGGTPDIQGLVSNAVTAIEKNTESKRHSRLELSIIPDTTEDMRAYGNKIVQITNDRSTRSEPEMNIVGRALETNNPKLLEDLKPIRDGYQNIINDTLLVPVPESLVQQHLDLLNAYEAIHTDIEAMLVSFSDPLYSLARVKRYESDAKGLLQSYTAIHAALNAVGIQYGNDEPGAFFYFLDTL